MWVVARFLTSDFSVDIGRCYGLLVCFVSMAALFTSWAQTREVTTDALSTPFEPDQMYANAGLVSVHNPDCRKVFVLQTWSLLDVRLPGKLETLFVGATMVAVRHLGVDVNALRSLRAHPDLGHTHSALCVLVNSDAPCPCISNDLVHVCSRTTDFWHLLQVVATGLTYNLSKHKAQGLTMEIEQCREKVSASVCNLIWVISETQSRNSSCEHMVRFKCQMKSSDLGLANIAQSLRDIVALQGRDHFYCHCAQSNRVGRSISWTATLRRDHVYNVPNPWTVLDYAYNKSTCARSMEDRDLYSSIDKLLRYPASLSCKYSCIYSTKPARVSTAQVTAQDVCFHSNFVTLLSAPAVVIGGSITQASFR